MIPDPLCPLAQVLREGLAHGRIVEALPERVDLQWGDRHQHTVGIGGAQQRLQGFVAVRAVDGLGVDEVTPFGHDAVEPALDTVRRQGVEARHVVGAGSQVDAAAVEVEAAAADLELAEAEGLGQGLVQDLLATLQADGHGVEAGFADVPAPRLEPGRLRHRRTRPGRHRRGELLDDATAVADLADHAQAGRRTGRGQFEQRRGHRDAHVGNTGVDQEGSQAGPAGGARVQPDIAAESARARLALPARQAALGDQVGDIVGGQAPHQGRQAHGAARLGPAGDVDLAPKPAHLAGRGAVAVQPQPRRHTVDADHDAATGPVGWNLCLAFIPGVVHGAGRAPGRVSAVPVGHHLAGHGTAGHFAEPPGSVGRRRCHRRNGGGALGDGEIVEPHRPLPGLGTTVVAYQEPVGTAAGPGAEDHVEPPPGRLASDPVRGLGKEDLGRRAIEAVTLVLHFQGDIAGSEFSAHGDGKGIGRVRLQHHRPRQVVEIGLWRDVDRQPQSSDAGLFDLGIRLQPTRAPARFAEEPTVESGRIQAIAECRRGPREGRGTEAPQAIQ